MIAIIIIIITYSVGIEFEYLIKSQIIIGNELLETTSHHTSNNTSSNSNNDMIRFKLSPSGKYIKAGSIEDVPSIQFKR